MASFATYPDLKGKVAIITGIGQSGTLKTASWGNGASIARGLAQNGVKIIGCDLNLKAAKFTASRIQAEGSHACHVVAADVTSASSVQMVVDTAMAMYGQIDILINNVGMPALGDAGSLSEEVWDQQINLNLKSVYLTCHAVLPIMEKQGSGVVVNNASIAGIRYIGKPQVAYSAAKAAVLQFTKVTAVGYATRGVRLNCVVPGLMLTPLVEAMEKSQKDGERELFRKITQHNVPTKAMGSSSDIAHATLFLASESAKYITGQSLIIDGGITSSTGTGFKL